jgi:hypothetical protein
MNARSGRDNVVDAALDAAVTVTIAAFVAEDVVAVVVRLGVVAADEVEAEDIEVENNAGLSSVVLDVALANTVVEANEVEAGGGGVSRVVVSVEVSAMEATVLVRVVVVVVVVDRGAKGSSIAASNTYCSALGPST